MSRPGCVRQHQQASQESERRTDLASIRSLLRRRAEVIAEQFVCAVYQVDFHFSAAIMNRDEIPIRVTERKHLTKRTICQLLRDWNAALFQMVVKSDSIIGTKPQYHALTEFRDCTKVNL